MRTLGILLLSICVPASAAVRTSGNVIVVTADERTLQFHRPFDLEGRTLRFTPDGAAYRVETLPLQWIDDTGPRFATFASPLDSATVTLTGFAFPFAGSARATLTLDGFGAIRFGALELTRNAQLYDVHVAGIDEPLIAPLLRSGRLDPRTAVHLRQESTFAVVTWLDPAFEVQARLGADGTIAFSYKRAPSFTNGAVVVTPGGGAWREVREVLATIAEPADDVAPMLDIREVDIARIAMSDILEVRIRVGAPIVASERLRYSIDIGTIDLNSGVDVFVSPSGVEYRAGNWTRVPLAGPAVRVDGDALVVRLSDAMIQWSGSVTIATAADSVTAPIEKGHVAGTAASDFSAGAFTRTGPVFETFTRGYVNTYAIWDEIRAATGLRDEDIDAVAIYTDLFIDLNALGLAYSTVGNDGASGVMLQAEDHDPVGPTRRCVRR